MSRVNGNADEDYVREVRRKARRLARARKRRGGFWRHLAHVGSLGFVFVLPVLAGAALGRVVAEKTNRPGVALVMLFVGLVTGGYASWRLIQQSLSEGDE
jgi:ATP synthase protein I